MAESAGRVHLRRGLAISLVAGTLLMAGCEGNGEDGGDRSETPSGPTGGVPTGAPDDGWSLAFATFNDAMDEYVDYYQREYPSAQPDEIEGKNESVDYLTGIQQELLDRLDTAIRLHDRLEPALENVVAQGAIPQRDLHALTQYVLVTDRWLSVKKQIAEGRLRCVQVTSNDIDRIKQCALKLAMDVREAESNALASIIGSLRDMLFGPS